MNDRHISGILAAFTVCAIFAVYAYQQSGGASRAKQQFEQAAQAEQKKAAEALRKLCRRITGECEATATVTLADCSVAKGKAELEQVLTAPIKQKGCQELEKSLASNCSGPCVYDSASLLIFGGKVNFDPPTAKQPDASCDLSAHKPVTASAHCVPKDVGATSSPTD